jgi:hypothetical protein
VKNANEELVRSLAERNPELRAMLAEHIAANSGELLPHLYMGEVTQWLVDAAASSCDDDVRESLAFLEQQFQNDESVRELIAVSFLENLPSRGEPSARIRQVLGPVLREELQRLES